MSATKSFTNGAIFAPPTAASLFVSCHYCAVCLANPSFLGELRAPLAATEFPLRAMCLANSSTLDEVRATLVAASITHIAMCPTNSSLTGQHSATLAAALFWATSSFRHSQL
jgi:hypothetical protein